VKILLVSPSSDILGFIGDWTESALKTLNCEVKRFDYRASRLGVFGKFRNHSSFIKEHVIKRMNSDLIKEVVAYRPEMVLVIFGEGISGNTLVEIRKKNVLLVNWFHDSIVMDIRLKFLKEFPKYYDFFLIIDSKEALKKVQIDCKNVELLSLACDENIHKKIELAQDERTIYSSDLTFFGTVVPHRAAVLETVADLNLSIWGPQKNIYGCWPEKYPGLAHCYKGRALHDPLEIVKVNNASKILINTHGLSGDKLYSLPSRIFETAGCGAFQITEYSDILAEHFNIGKEIVCYKKPEELRELAKYYLSSDKEREAIANAGQIRAYRDHTFIKRMRELLEKIKR